MCTYFQKAQSCIFVDQKLVSYILLAHEGTTIKRDFLVCQMDYVRFTTIYFSRTKNCVGFFVVSCLCFMTFCVLLILEEHHLKDEQLCP